MPLNIPMPVSRQCSYGGWTFGASMQTQSFSLKAVPDASGRATAFVGVAISIRAHITIGS